MKVEYISHLGNDLFIANCARVSFAKWHEELEQSDEKLIKYLAKHNHISPFFHPTISLRVKAPFFIARQALRSQVGLAINEVSRRYVDSPPEVFEFEVLRGRADDKKQGSAGPLEGDLLKRVTDALDECLKNSLDTYDYLIKMGVCPEQARGVLPLSTMTQWIWTGSLAAFARVYNLRSTPDAQFEIQLLAKELDMIISPLFPIGWKALIEKN